MKALLGLVLPVLFFSLSASATLEDDFNAIKNSGRDFVTTGTVCEEVAKVQMERQFRQPQYTIITGIAYGDSQRTIGELDVVVFENRTHEVVKIGEVKCWKDMSAGLHKARDQRQRFLETVRNRQGLFFQSTEDHRRFDQSQFDEVRDFVSIAQKGSTAVGYDIELEYSLADLMKLRSWVLQCQNDGNCPRPRN